MRFKDYAGSVVFTTCLGAVAGARESVFDWRIMLLVVANWLSVGFAFAFDADPPRSFMLAKRGDGS